jgi:hypothetical protein
VVNNETWRCDRPLSSYGTLPILVEQTWDNDASRNDSISDGVWLENGCSGDGNPSTIDLILHINGNGSSVGTADDAMTIKQGAHDIEITGYFECGARGPDGHPDGAQIMGGERITFYDFRSGDISSLRWTCHGSGGIFYVDETNGWPTDIVCVRCRMAAYNQGLRVDASTRSGARDSTFSGRLPIQVNTLGDAIDPVNINNLGIRT